MTALIATPVLSFFTGGGFLDIGFEEAGFDVVWTNEFNTPIADMYEFAMTSWRRSKHELSPPALISDRQSIRALSASQVMQQAFEGKRPALFGVIGGPPCTDFSVGGHNKGADGKHGALTKVFADLISQILPDFFVIENVPGLYRTKAHREFLSSVVRSLETEPCGYITTMRVLSSLELGVPQDRERLFLIGFRRHLVESRMQRGVLQGENDWFPWPQAVYPNAKKLPWPKTSPFGSPVRQPEGVPLGLTVYPLLVGPPDPKDLPNGQEHFVAHSPKFSQISEGDDSGKSFKRLHRYKYSPTAWYGNNEVHLHPWEPRRLTVREALRIQTVPDAYALPPESPLTAKYRLICNGVPCKLAQHIAVSVSRFLSSDIEQHGKGRSSR